ncbi:DUF2971 domain-containing protein [Photobacterium sp. GB-1]|uniref:DUF2971 domain-containing protein n=1 Tax=Photobacterium sp. GB-1 TaxID=2022111 RepID=UPI000D1619C3|nr:DUF2971 domain-containing protein [Photobacterium sp. GB-1]PSV52351.1 hypothetical protein C9J45_11890 [Photobacterium sp. GB-1]
MLFKYLPKERVNVLDDLKIRFTPLRSLNDPYESFPLIDAEEARRSAIKSASEELDLFWEQTELSDRTEKNKKTLEDNRKAIIRGVEDSIRPELIANDLMDNLGDLFGVLSLSRSKTSLLMWSHYCGSHTGLVIGFDDNHDFFHQNDLDGYRTKPLPVKYSDQRAIVKVDSHNCRENMLCHKPLEWAYEQEERVFMAYMDESKAIGKDEFGAAVILMDIPPKAIKEVYIGCNASEETKLRILNAKRLNKLDCIIYESKMSLTEYKLIFSELTEIVN